MLSNLFKFFVCSFFIIMSADAQTNAAAEKVVVVPDQELKDSAAAGEAWLN